MFDRVPPEPVCRNENYTRIALTMRDSVPFFLLVPARIAMPSDRLSATLRENRPSRRRFLATLGAVASASTAGCSKVLPGSGSSSTHEPSEVIVENRTSSKAEIAVRVVGSEEETLFSRVFTLGPEEMMGRGTIETSPSRVHAFTADGVSHTWRYAPDLPADFDCELKDLGLTLHRDNTIEPWYSC